MIIKNTVFIKGTMSDLLAYHKDDVALDINCHAIGTIQSFNATNQTATASINYQKVIYEYVGNSFGPVLVNYPILVDCPVQFLFSGVGGFTTPPQKGDECLISFNDRDMDAWFDGDSNNAPTTSRLHSFADGIIFVGIKSSPNSILKFDNTRPMMRNFSGDTFVAVTASQIEISNSNYTLNGLLQELLTEIQNITVLCAGSGSPSGTPINSAAISATATKIQNLLL